jgi:cbb3-type cytochrome oxidase subunit 3
MESNEILIPITLFICTFGVLYVYFNTRHKERMAMIEKGADASLFQSKGTWAKGSLRLGMFLVGIALGILTGNILDETTALKDEVAYFSMIFLFGGLSLVAFYMFLDKRREAVRQNN